MLGGIDHARGRVFILNEKRAPENKLATKTASIAASALIRLPAIKDIVGKKACQKPSASGAPGMTSVKEARDLAKSYERLRPVNPPVRKCWYFDLF